MSQAFNRYMYVMGNPVRYSDPTGHFSLGGCIGGIVGALVGGSTGAAFGYLAGSRYRSIGNAAGRAWNSTSLYLGGHWKQIGSMSWPLGAIYGYAFESDGNFTPEFAERGACRTIQRLFRRGVRLKRN